jgi:hypothetical protein
METIHLGAFYCELLVKDIWGMVPQSDVADCPFETQRYYLMNGPPQVIYIRDPAIRRRLEAIALSHPIAHKMFRDAQDFQWMFWEHGVVDLKPMPRIDAWFTFSV